MREKDKALRKKMADEDFARSVALQDVEVSLAEDSQMIALVTAYAACPPRIRKAALKDISRFVVGFMDRRLNAQ